MNKLLELLNELIVLVDELHELYRLGSNYPSEKIEFIKKSFNFYNCEVALERIDTPQDISFIPRLKNKIEQIKDNPDVLYRISLYMWFSKIPWKSMLDIEEDLKSQLNLYYQKLSIIQERFSAKSEASGKLIQLSSSAARDIFELEYKGKSIFPFKTTEEKETIIDCLQKFIANQLEMLSVPLNIIIAEKQLGYYLITEIAKAAKIEYVHIMNITINDSAFDESRRSVAYSKIKKNIAEKNLRTEKELFINDIDEIINNHSR
jgi:hypothetical protein